MKKIQQWTCLPIVQAHLYSRLHFGLCRKPSLSFSQTEPLMLWDCSSLLKEARSLSWGSKSNWEKRCSQYLSACHQSKAVATYSYMCLEVSIVTGAKPGERHMQRGETESLSDPLLCHVHYGAILLQHPQAFTNTVWCTPEKLKAGAHFRIQPSGRSVGTVWQKSPDYIGPKMRDTHESTHQLNRWPRAGAGHTSVGHTKPCWAQSEEKAHCGTPRDCPQGSLFKAVMYNQIFSFHSNFPAPTSSCICRCNLQEQNNLFYLQQHKD